MDSDISPQNAQYATGTDGSHVPEFGYHQLMYKSAGGPGRFHGNRVPKGVSTAPIGRRNPSRAHTTHPPPCDHPLQSPEHHGTPAHNCRHPPPPHPPAVSARLADISEDDLSNMLMSWYYAGYYTGKHAGMVQANRDMNYNE